MCEAFDAANPPTPVPTLVPTRALWDTGATRSVIAAALAQSLKLLPAGKARVQHGGGSGDSPTYVVNFRLPNHVDIAGAIVTEWPAPPDFGVILGMDVIGLGDFSITNVGGQTWMSFRTPSCVAIDYVAEFNKLRFAGIGRNDPCPCSSGKKFKKCHGM